MSNDKQEYRIARFPKQILILVWKNLLLSRRNLFGTVLEMLCPYLFISFMLVIRSFMERIRLTSQFNMPTSVLDVRLGSFNQTRNLILYFPNTNFVRRLVDNAVNLIVQNNPGFIPIG